MSVSNRKIGFYTLVLKKTGAEDDLLDPYELRSTFTFLMDKEKSERVMDMPSSNKFHLLYNESIDGILQNLVFCSAKYNHRPPLIRKDTAEERSNPKTLDEGELEKTHVTFCYQDKEIIILIEERKVGISIGKLVHYLENFTKIMFNLNGIDLDYHLDYGIIPKDDFLNELSKLSRVRVGTIYTNKQLLGSEHMNFSNRLDEVQEDIEITLKAKRKESIRGVLRDFYNDLISEGTRISKIRVFGTNADGNKVILDTNFIKKIEYVKIDINEQTGVVNSTSMFESFTQIAQSIIQ